MCPNRRTAFGLLVGLLGVPDDVIADDYAISADAMEKLVAWVREHRPESADAMTAQPAAILSCPAEAMLGFLDHVRTAWGSIDAYLTDVGVPEETITTVRAALLEPVR